MFLLTEYLIKWTRTLILCTKLTYESWTKLCGRILLSIKRFSVNSVQIFVPVFLLQHAYVLFSKNVPHGTLLGGNGGWEISCNNFLSRVHSYCKCWRLVGSWLALWARWNSLSCLLWLRTVQHSSDCKQSITNHNRTRLQLKASLSLSPVSECTCR